MKINYIKTLGFRKFEQEFETNLHATTYISGGNTKGKTNILYAIIWVFLGTNLTGDDKQWLGNKKSDSCYVELKFTDNLGINHVLARYKNKFDNNKNFIMLDEKKSSQDDLQRFYCDKKLFLSILNPNYFLSKKTSEQKQLLDSYLPEIDIQTIYHKLDDSEKNYLEGCPQNMVQYIKDLNENKTMYENKIKNLQGKIEYAENVINSTIIETKKTFKKDEELLLIRQELSYLIADKNSIDKKNQETIVLNLNNQISQIEGQIKDLDIKMRTGKNIYLSIKTSPISHCVLCEQEIKNQSRNVTIKNMKKELEKLFEQKNQLLVELSDLKNNLTIERCNLHALEGNNSIEKEEQITNVQNRIELLEQEQLEIDRFNNSIELNQRNITSSKQDISIFNKQIEDLENMINNVKQTKIISQKLYLNYIEEKMKFATKHLKNVKIRYYTVLKDSGELKDDFVILYNNNELKTLSRSETIATSVELSNMLNKVANVNFPLFIDDSESCADYNFVEDYSKDTQVLISRVKKEQDLIISDYNNEGTMQIAA